MKAFAFVLSILFCAPAFGVTSDCKELSWIVMYDEDKVTKEALIESLKVIGGAYNLRGQVAGRVIAWLVMDYQTGAYSTDEEDQQVLDNALSSLKALPGVRVSCNETASPL